MKALRNWMRDNEKLREIYADTQERAIPARVGDQMRDVILAMADVMEAVERHDGSTYDRVTSLEPVYEAAVKVIKEMTKERSE